jgi:O-antigen/teichoic acid export membrane protein
VFVATGLVVTGGILVQDIIGHPEIPLGLFASLFAVQLLCSLFYAILIGLRNQSAVNWLFAYGSIAYPALIGVLLVFRGNLDVLVVAVCMVLLPAVMGMYSLYLVLKQVASQEGTEERSFHWGSFLQYAAKSTAMGAGSIIYLQVVVMVLSVRCNAADVGVFSVAMMLIDTTMVIPSMIIAFVLPRWSGLSRAEVFIRASRVVRLTHPITLLIAVGVTVLGIALAEPIFGKDFTEVGKLALIMVPGAWATTGITVVSTCFLAQNQHKVPTILAWMGAVLAGGLVWWLLPVYGCIGAAMAVSISRLVMLSWGRYEFRRADPGVPHVWWTPTREDFHAWSQIIGHTLQKVRKGS